MPRTQTKKRRTTSSQAITSQPTTPNSNSNDQHVEHGHDLEEKRAAPNWNTLRIPRTVWPVQPEYGTIGKSKASNTNGRFKHPHGVAFDPHNQLIAVTDCDNHRVQIFNQELQFVTVVGCKGTNNGQFTYPCGIVYQPSTNNMIVTDEHRLQVYCVVVADSYQHLFSIGSAEYGSKQEEFNFPCVLMTPTKP